MSKSLVLEKSCAFALRIVKLYQYLCATKNEFVLSKQLLLAGTHIGARVKEATQGESRNIFISEMSIALRKASETEYWLDLLFRGGYLEEKEFASINRDCLELIKMLTAIVKTSRGNQKED